MKILILASNPRKDLDLDGEIKIVRTAIDYSRDRDQIQVISEPGVQVGDLQRLLLRHRPEIVHFCGHGSGKEGLIFKQEGGEQWLRTDALANLFGLNPICRQVKCVVLNACYAEEQANAIVSHIDYVVGASHEIQDQAAIVFSKGFYLALGEGCSVEDAFEFGKNAIQLEVSGSSTKMRSATGLQRKAEVIDAVTTTEIPEHWKLVLKRRVDLLQTTSTPLLSQAERETIQLHIADSLLEDQHQTQFRAQVQDYLADHKLADHERVFLDGLREDLGLSVEDAERLLEEELAPIRKAQEDYCRRLWALINRNLYPFNDAIQAELKKFQISRNLLDDEVEEIAAPILAEAQAAYEQRMSQPVQQPQKPLSQQTQTTQSGLRLQSFEFQTPKLAVVQRQGGPDVDITYQLGQANYFVEDLGNGITLEMVAIAGGAFKMGHPETEKQELIQQYGEKDYQSDFARELPQHRVTVQPFWMGKFAITQAQYQAIAGENPARFKGKNRPVEQVTWYNAVQFCDQLSQKTGRSYRLPSEAEWEYACRAGTTTPFYCGETLTTELANYDGDSPYNSDLKGAYREQTTEVGHFPPNAFGLYDMHGNIWEWCADNWHENYQGAPTDGSVWITGGDSSYRLIRGGSWSYLPMLCCSAYRYRSGPDNTDSGIGFRVVFSAA